MSATDMAPARPESAEPGDERRSGRGGPRARRALRVLAPGLVFLGIREVGLLVLMWMAGRNDTVVGDALRSWDGEWFLAIAAGGYDNVHTGLVDAFGRRSAETPLAFFPGYPTVVGLLHDLGFALVPSALAVTTAAGVVCAYGLARLGTLVRGGSRRAGLVLVALFAATPMSIVLSMAYSEALFCAFAVWSLVFLLQATTPRPPAPAENRTGAAPALPRGASPAPAYRPNGVGGGKNVRLWTTRTPVGNWVAAGACCALAGLMRPTAAALVLAVGLAAVAAVVRRRDGWRPWVGGALAPVGLVGYLAWVGSRTGEWDGWFALQRRGWDSEFDGGAATLRFSLDVLGSARSVLEVTTVGLIVVALALLAIGVVRRLEWPLLVYAVGVLAMDLGSNGLMNSKARLMVPAFTLLVPVAIGLAKRKTSTVVLTLCGLAVAGSWFGAYSITAWGYAI